MRIISRTPLQTFWANHPDVAMPLQRWINLVEAAAWRSPAEVKAAIGNASILGNNRVVFNVKGNDYRLIVAILYHRQNVLVKFIGTHAAYDKVNAETGEIGD